MAASSARLCESKQRRGCPSHSLQLVQESLVVQQRWGRTVVSGCSKKRRKTIERLIPLLGCSFYCECHHHSFSKHCLMTKTHLAARSEQQKIQPAKLKKQKADCSTKNPMPQNREELLRDD
eukprot:3057472-Amphidinium_carterae.1